MSLSANEFEGVLKGAFWAEIESELNVWIEQLRSCLEDPDSDVEIKDIHQLQGSLKAVRHVLNMPHVLLEEKRIQQEAKKKEKES